MSGQPRTAAEQPRDDTGRPGRRTRTPHPAVGGAARGRSGTTAPPGLRAAGWIVVGFLAVAVLDAGYVAGKVAGLALAGTLLAVVGLLTARTAIPSGRRKAKTEAEQHKADVEATQADFPAFLEISSDVTWATVSQRHFDHGIRSRLTRLLDTRLAERHGMTIAAQPERARELAGEDLWPLIDPARPLSEDSNAPGISLAKLTRIITRLEEL